MQNIYGEVLNSEGNTDLFQFFNLFLAYNRIVYSQHLHSLLFFQTVLVHPDDDLWSWKGASEKALRFLNQQDTTKQTGNTGNTGNTESIPKSTIRHFPINKTLFSDTENNHHQRGSWWLSMKFNKRKSHQGAKQTTSLDLYHCQGVEDSRRLERALCYL